MRRDAAVELGRLKADNAVEPLMRMLAKDANPVARVRQWLAWAERSRA